MNHSTAAVNVKPSDVLRRAAERLERHVCIGCCAAIKRQYDVPHTTVNRAYTLFTSLYKPSKKTNYQYWFHDGEDWDAEPEHRQHRIMALLLTADMAESVGE